jgi:hypothetical protein
MVFLTMRIDIDYYCKDYGTYMEFDLWL